MGEVAGSKTSRQYNAVRSDKLGFAGELDGYRKAHQFCQLQDAEGVIVVKLNGCSVFLPILMEKVYNVVGVVAEIIWLWIAFVVCVLLYLMLINILKDNTVAQGYP